MFIKFGGTTPFPSAGPRTVTAWVVPLSIICNMAGNIVVGGRYPSSQKLYTINCKKYKKKKIMGGIPYNSWSTNNPPPLFFNCILEKKGKSKIKGGGGI